MLGFVKHAGLETGLSKVDEQIGKQLVSPELGESLGLVMRCYLAYARLVTVSKRNFIIGKCIKYIIHRNVKARRGLTLGGSLIVAALIRSRRFTLNNGYKPRSARRN